MIPADELGNKFHDEYDRFAGNLQAMGGLGAQSSIWVRNMTMYVRVRLADASRTREWREVEAENLYEAVKVAEQMDDVEVVLEASTVPGGEVT